MDKICVNCRFFLEILNQCRFNAPMAGLKDPWPWVSQGDFCGQWKAKEKDVE